LWPGADAGIMSAVAAVGSSYDVAATSDNGWRIGYAQCASSIVTNSDERAGRVGEAAGPSACEHYSSGWCGWRGCIGVDYGRGATCRIIRHDRARVT